MSVWIVTVTALDIDNNILVFRYSDGAYIDSSNQYFEPRMIQPALVKVSPNDGGNFNIFSSPSIGEIQLINSDGGLDYLADYALDNGNCVLSLIDDNGTQIDYLTGKVESMQNQANRVNLTVRAMTEVLSRVHHNVRYLGNNVLPAGVEGVATDIKGNVKPVVYGSVKNATPVLVNTTRSIYQVSARNTCTVSAVYEKGGSITLGTTYTFANFATFETSTPTTGTFNRCAGYIKLPVVATGTITVDATDTTVLAGDVFEAILNELSVTIPLDATSKTLLNSCGEIGFYVDSETNTTDLLNRIIKSCGAVWYFIGTTIYAKLIALATTSVIDLTESEIISIDRSACGIGKNGLPVWSVSMIYNRLETTQQETELAITVSAARKAELAKGFQNFPTVDADVFARHAMSQTIDIDSVLRNESDAIAVATRLILLAKNRVDVVTVTAVVESIPNLNLFDGVNVITKKLGYSAGRLMTVISYELDIKRKRYVLELIG
jgi:hypothetical protein